MPLWIVSWVNNFSENLLVLEWFVRANSRLCVNAQRFVPFGRTAKTTSDPPSFSARNSIVARALPKKSVC